MVQYSLTVLTFDWFAKEKEQVQVCGGWGSWVGLTSHKRQGQGESVRLSSQTDPTLAAELTVALELSVRFWNIELSDGLHEQAVHGGAQTCS